MDITTGGLSRTRKYSDVNFDQAIKNLNRSLSKKNPSTFNHAWVKNSVRKSYNFITENVKTELGETDWDKIVSRLDNQHQKLWLRGFKVKKIIKQYEDIVEVDAILDKYQANLYTFLVQTSKEEKKICDQISIRLVRTAQKGNLLAKKKAIDFIKQLVEQWIESRNLKHWRGYNDRIEENIDRCIRRYRYSGSFIVYLYRTLECAGRGLRSLEAFSLDDYSPITERRRSENLVYDQDTGETCLYSLKR
ncbi:MAG: hypothetical protein UT48_C0005G0033 [Parcubacteria group bacterium GW2011_GWE2_39_37]|nr:MAG: hypothetical protein UT48_C0005G0033 [Parcubacteria group bacterium GW2011_GWE2_39_37]